MKRIDKYKYLLPVVVRNNTVTKQAEKEMELNPRRDEYKNGVENKEIVKTTVENRDFRKKCNITQEARQFKIKEDVNSSMPANLRQDIAIIHKKSVAPSIGTDEFP
jgi:hypothetical protein